MKQSLNSLVLALALGATAANAADWTQWRGLNRADYSSETGLLQDWPAGGPKQVWMFKNAGNGYSAPAVVGGRLFTLGTRDGGEVLLALDAKTGSELWAVKVGSILKNNWGDGPRGTPTVDGGQIYALSGSGNLVCLSTSSGKILWQKSLTELGGKVPFWGYTESPLVDANQVVVLPGGSKGAVAALNKKTGDVIWQSADFTDEAQYSSLVPATINGISQYIGLTMKSIVGIAAKDGKVLWKAAFPGATAVIPTPIQKDGYVYVAAGYGVGCKMVKIGADNTVTDVYANKVMKNHHGGVVLLGDHLYGYSDGVGWVCQDFKTGAEVWSNKADLGKGALSGADGRFYCLDQDSGAVALIEASPKGWKEHGRFKLDPQTTIRSKEGRIWTHPVISGGKLYLRDQDLIYCYDVKK